MAGSNQRYLIDYAWIFIFAGIMTYFWIVDNMQNIDLKFEKMEVLKNLTSNFESQNSRIKQIDTEIFDNKLLIDKENIKKAEQSKSLSVVSKKKEEF